ncbi:MAG: hypothetical protein ACRBBW_15470 [Cellvibrionaceae bacterium]
MSQLKTQKTPNRFTLGFAVILLALIPAAVHSETIKVPVGQQGQSQNVDKPALGMTMDSVRTLFGTPVTQSPPRGEPPITRWEYNDFVVYFESDLVIHSVTKHRRTD